MKTLVIDRSTDVQSLAFIGDDGVEETRELEGTDCRSGEWAVKVEEFLAGRRPDRIVVGTGPGSFAGIRAALAFAQGYAVGSGCEVMGLPSPCAFAPAEGPLAVVGDARQGKYWIALFEGRRLVTDVFQVEKDLLPLRVPLGVPVVTPDAKRIDAFLKETFEDRYQGGVSPTAKGLADFFRATPSVLKPEPLPLYLNPAVRP